MESLLNISKPCAERWDTMKIGVNSRYCDNCQKNVIDFTNKDKNVILEYLLTRQNESVCGRIYRSQLDFSNTDLLVTIQTFSSQIKNTNIPFYLLTVGTLILAGCNNNTSERPVSSISDSTITATDSVKDVVEKNEPKEPKVTINKAVKTVKDPPEIPLDLVLGEMAIYPDSIYGSTEPYLFVEIMPEYKGGIDSFMSFVRRNLTYPDWERENKIEGKVLVSFIVDQNGKIKDAKIIRSVQGSKNFDKEVIRVINSMPDWTPGQQHGKNVDVQIHAPINFKL